MDPWPSDYLVDAVHKTDADTASRALRLANVQIRKRLPPLLTLGHLAWHVDVPYSFLREVSKRERDAYREFVIHKRNGQPRYIAVPHPQLLRTQRWIAQHVLSTQPVRHPSYAYGAGCSPRACALQHCGADWLVKLDIKQFFESISEIQVYRVFRSMGYERLLSFQMARVCTRVVDSRARYKNPQWQRRNRRDDIAGIEDRIGFLPQGAPTSPMLSNLVVTEFDRTVDGIAARFDTVYTRYSDDLVFSTKSTAFTRAVASDLIYAVYDSMKMVGLRPNTTKTCVVPPGARRQVLGLLVDGVRPRLTREWRETLESHLYFIEKFGFVEHAARRNFDSSLGLKLHLEGLIAYAKGIDVNYGKHMADEFNRVWR